MGAPASPFPVPSARTAPRRAGAQILGRPRVCRVKITGKWTSGSMKTDVQEGCVCCPGGGEPVLEPRSQSPRADVRPRGQARQRAPAWSARGSSLRGGVAVKG